VRRRRWWSQRRRERPRRRIPTSPSATCPHSSSTLSKLIFSNTRFHRCFSAIVLISYRSPPFYLSFANSANRERVKTEHPEAKFGDIAKILSQEYKALPEKEKKQWEDLAEKDKERYKREMEDYEPPSDDSDDDGKRRKKKKKDPNAPKRNQSAFFIYSNTHRATVKQNNPDASFGDIAKIISKLFKALSEKERSKYDKLALEDKARYQREMAAYKGA